MYTHKYGIVLNSLFILLTRRKAMEALYIGQRIPRLAFRDTEILLSNLFFYPTACKNMFIKNKSNYKTRNKPFLFKNVVIL